MTKITLHFSTEKIQFKNFDDEGVEILKKAFIEKEKFLTHFHWINMNNVTFIEIEDDD